MEHQGTEEELHEMEEDQMKKLRSLLVLADTVNINSWLCHRPAPSRVTKSVLLNSSVSKYASAVSKSLQCVYSLAVLGCWMECEQQST